MQALTKLKVLDFISVASQLVFEAGKIIHEVQSSNDLQK